MSARIPLVIGNWKMELSFKAELALARGIKNRLKEVREPEVVVCPSFTALGAIREELGKSNVALGAQTVHWKERGAWTGEVSVHQLRGLVEWCLVGHSEQRALTGQSNEQVVQAALLLLSQGITPIYCLGETEEERVREESVARITEQIEQLLSKMTRTSLTKLVVAYEPIWAIGSGVTPDSNEVAGTLLLIRKLVAARFSSQAAERLRIIYGGSVSLGNAELFLREPGIDGLLVGGAAVNLRQFVEMVELARRVTSNL
jgi:triosephosphate isomerase